MRSIAAAALTALLSVACASTPPPKLGAIAEAYWQHQLAQSATVRSELGLPVEHLPDVSYAHAQAEAAFARELLAQLERVDETRLTDDERITLGILEHLQC